MSLTRTGAPGAARAGAAVVGPAAAGDVPAAADAGPAPGGAPVASGPPSQVVPVRAVPVALAAIVGLVVAIAGNWMWALDFFHVAAGALWTAIDLFVGLI